jgi:hypothetical protein
LKRIKQWTPELEKKTNGFGSATLAFVYMYNTEILLLRSNFKATFIIIFKHNFALFNTAFWIREIGPGAAVPSVLRDKLWKYERLKKKFER